MIIYNSSKVNNKNITKKIKEYEELNNITGCCCLNCGSKDFLYYGSYQRNIVEIAGERIETVINIKRLQCCKCKKTHAVIPSFLIPYKQHTLNTINEILTEKIVDEKTYNEIEETTGVSRQLQKYWRVQLDSLRGKLEILFLIFAYKKLVKKLSKENNIIEKFFNEYKEVYMLNRSQVFYCYAST